MFSAYAKAVSQSSDPRFRGVLIKTLLTSFALLAVLCVVTLWLLADVSQENLAALPGWAASVIEILVGTVAAIFLAWFLFPVFASIVIGFFLDDIARAVEDVHYASLPRPRDQGVGEVVLEAMKFVAIALLLNLLVLPFWLIGIGFILFYVVNGYLVGREYFDMVAQRRLAPDDAKKLRVENRTRVFMFGVLTAFLLTVPIVNLLTPVFATAAMVHLFQSLRP